MSNTASTDPRPKGNKAMLSLPELQELLGKAILDNDLRERLLKEPSKTLRELGYPNHSEVIKFFETLGKQGFEDAAKAFHGFTTKRGDPAFDHGET